MGIEYAGVLKRGETKPATGRVSASAHPDVPAFRATIDGTPRCARLESRLVPPQSPAFQAPAAAWWSPSTGKPGMAAQTADAETARNVGGSHRTPLQLWGSSKPDLLIKLI